MLRLLCLFFGINLWLCAAGTAPTYLVFPFTNNTGNSGLDWLGEAFSEAAQEALSAANLLTLDRDERQTALSRLKVDPGAVSIATMLRAGEVLGASHLVLGEYSFQGETGSGPLLAVKARIVNLSGRHTQGQTEHQAPLTDFSRMRIRMAWQILSEAEPGRAPAWEQWQTVTPIVRADAVENHIRGLLAADDDEGHRLWAQAARLDESYWPPRYQLARVNWTSANYRAALRWLENFPETQPRYLQAQFLAGLCSYATGDFAGARNAFGIVARDVPIAEVLNNLGAGQSRLGEPGALQSFEQALAADPKDPDYRFNLAYHLWKSGQFEEAARHLGTLLEATPDDDEARLLLARAQEKVGLRPQDTSLLALERLKDSFPEFAFRQLKQLIAGPRPVE